MCITQGTFGFASNFEVGYVQPLDARSVTGNLSDLNDGVYITYPYSGMLVSVVSDSASTTNNGLYICTNPGTAGNVADGTSVWEKIGAGVSFTGNSWTYSSNTLNLNYQGGTFPVTGFTFLNLSGGTVSGTTDGLLTLSGSSNPLRIFGLSGNNTSNYLVWDPTSGNVTYRSLSAVTGGSYVASAGTIYLSGNTNEIINGFDYVNNLTISNNRISGYTNISGTSVVYGGVIDAVTGGTFSSGNLYLSGTGVLSSGLTITGFSTPLSAVTGGTYIASAGTIYFSGGTNPTIGTFDYVNNLTVTNNTISGYTNISGTSVVYGGVVNAITGGTYSDGQITFSGSGNILSGVTGFNVLSGTGVDVSYVNDSTGYGLQVDATNQRISFRLNNNTILSAGTGSLKDFYVTAGTYNLTAGTITFYNTSGGSFPVSGFTTGLTSTTGATYYPSQGVIEFTKTGAAPAYSATSFNYLTGFTISSANTISGYTNISGSSVAFGGVINAVTGGSFSNGILTFSGTGNFLSGITGFGTGSATITGGIDNYITKWSGTSALTTSQIYENNTNIGIGLTGATNKLHISATTHPLRIEGIQQSAQTQETTKFLMINDSGVVGWNTVTPTTGISIYITAFTSSFPTNALNPTVDFIPTGTTQNYRGVTYQYLITSNLGGTTRMGTLQGLWSSGQTPYVSYSDVGPTQITDSTYEIFSLYLSAVTGGINTIVYCDGGSYTFKAYKVLL